MTFIDRLPACIRPLLKIEGVRFWLAIVLVNFFGTTAIAQAEGFTFSGPFNERMALHDYVEVYFDTSGSSTISTILNDEGILFKTKAQGQNQPEFPLVLWLRIRFNNEGKEDLPAVLTFCHLLDSVELYLCTNGTVSYSAQTGRAYKPTEKSIPSVTPVQNDLSSTKVKRKTGRSGGDFNFSLF